MAIDVEVASKFPFTVLEEIEKVWDLTKVTQLISKQQRQISNPEFSYFRGHPPVGSDSFRPRYNESQLFLYMFIFPLKF